MEIKTVSGVVIEGICAAVPNAEIANDAKIAEATGIRTRRVVDQGTTVVDLCVQAAEKVIAETNAEIADFGAIIFVSFTQHHRMPCAAAQAQSRLNFPKDIVAFDVTLACSGWGYGLYLAGLLARETGRKVLLLDGDVQSEFLDSSDRDTATLLSDGGTATVIAPKDGGEAWRFAFLTDGSQGRALQLEHGGTIRMDGFGVFKFVATDVANFLKEFSSKVGAVDKFVPHQANAYIVRQLSKSVGFTAEQTVVACEELGNMSSASVPVAIASNNVRGKLLISGFGGGLSISAAALTITAECRLAVV